MLVGTTDDWKVELIQTQNPPSHTWEIISYSARHIPISSTNMARSDGFIELFLICKYRSWDWCGFIGAQFPTCASFRGWGRSSRTNIHLCRNMWLLWASEHPWQAPCPPIGWTPRTWPPCQEFDRYSLVLCENSAFVQNIFLHCWVYTINSFCSASSWPVHSVEFKSLIDEPSTVFAVSSMMSSFMVSSYCMRTRMFGLLSLCNCGQHVEVNTTQFRSWIAALIRSWDNGH